MTAATEKKHNRKKDGHPLVGLTRNKKTGRWRTYTDREQPDGTKRRLWVEVPEHDAATYVRRKAFAVRRQQEEEQARKKLAKLKGSAQIDEAIDARLAQLAAELAPRTLITYRVVGEFMKQWARQHRVKSTADLGPEKLYDLGRAICMRGKKRPRTRRELKAAERGRLEAEGADNETIRKAVAAVRVPEKSLGVETDERRSERAQLKELITAGAILRHWAKLRMLPDVLTTDVSGLLGETIPLRAENGEKLPPKPIEFLNAAEVAALLKAVQKHDADAGKALGTSKLTHGTIGDAVKLYLLLGCRAQELLSLKWSDVNLSAKEITRKREKLPPTSVRIFAAKTASVRYVTLTESSAALTILKALEGRRKGKPGDLVVGCICDPERRKTVGPVPTCACGGLTTAEIRNGFKRLARRYDAPVASPQICRRTCCTFLVNAPGVWKGASLFKAAKRHGHTAAVAEKHYAGLVEVKATAKTVEACYGCAKLFE